MGRKERNIIGRKESKIMGRRKGRQWVEGKEYN